MKDMTMAELAALQNQQEVAILDVRDQEDFLDKAVEGLQDLRAAREIFFAVFVHADL